jgi:cytidylate kinase
MNEEEITGKITKLKQLRNELIYAFMQTGMSYRQAEEVLSHLAIMEHEQKSKETEKVKLKGF